MKIYKPLILVQGTCEDRASTCNITELDRLAREHCYNYKYIDGVGSSGRTVKMGTYFDSQILEPYYFEGGSGGMGLLEYALRMAKDAATGYGLRYMVDEIKEYILEGIHPTVADLLGVTICGFSRGAVAIAQALQEIEMERPSLKMDVTVILLDPVPGPFLNKSYQTPECVKHLYLYKSRDEGRPGFGAADILLNPTTHFEGYIVNGVHGDIGGSTKSNTSKLILDDVKQIIGFNNCMSSSERITLALEQGLNGYDIGWPNYFSRRGDRSPSSHCSDFELPYQKVADEFFRRVDVSLMGKDIWMLSPFSPHLSKLITYDYHKAERFFKANSTLQVRYPSALQKCSQSRRVKLVPSYMPKLYAADMFKLLLRYFPK
ncbi:hypothetical protein L1D34_15210 [Vibrio mediterranei]|uniref:hypothetical protein n=1 Tax=Vibrio mediterranei TaxID=689 RepID=UPI001EFC66F0|nr:hypothetical protein [Vibrio mediterranei]MCG9626188.1 hypothetical protein [Vibrio mediterranei]